jgi:hypothetical protein
MASERDEQRAAGPANADQPDEEVLRETREAGMRAEGGGSSDEDAIREAAQDGTDGS